MEVVETLETPPVETPETMVAFEAMNTVEEDQPLDLVSVESNEQSESVPSQEEEEEIKETEQEETIKDSEGEDVDVPDENNPLPEREEEEEEEEPHLLSGLASIPR